MPKAILEFDLPEEEAELRLAQDGANLSYAINEFDNWLRGLIKHGTGDEFEGKSATEVLEIVRDTLYDELQDTEWRRR